MRHLRTRLFFLLAVSLLLCFALGWLFQSVVLRDRLSDYAARELDGRLEASLLALERSDSSEWRTVLEELGKALRCRITVIAPDGKVLVDSEADAATLENHRNRPEVQASLAEGHGSDTRYSQSVKKNMLYVARFVPVHGEALVVRTAFPLALLRDVLSAGRLSLGAALLLAAAASLFLGTLFLRQLVQPIQALVKAVNKGGPISLPPLPVRPSAEVQELALALKNMAERNEQILQQLQEERTYLERILASLPVGVLVVNREGKIRYENPPLGKLLRMPSQKGHPFQGVLRSPELVELLEDALRGRDGTCNVVLREEQRFLLAQAVSVAGGAIAVLQDMTERHLLEESRKAFVADAGHELQTPLTIIRAAAELLLEEGSSENQRSYLERILEQQERISALMDDLLLLSRLDSGTAVPLDLTEEVDLAELCRVAREEAALHPLAEHLEWEVDLPESAPFTGWSEGLLRCVTNLLDNAVKYTAGRFEANPGGKISLRMVRDDLLQAWRIVVADNGIGIPETMRHCIFERFRRGDASRVRNGKAKGGYGLGLAIVKRMAELHGGSVLLEESDEGAAFTIVLPDPPSGASQREEAPERG